MKNRGLILFMLLLSGAVAAQIKNVQPMHKLPRVSHLSIKDGLDACFAPSMVEDKQRGMIWLGMHNGIWRHDGETLLKVHPRQQSGQLSTDSYLAINLFLADARGDIWFYDERRCLKRLSHTTGKIEQFYVRDAGRDSSISFKPLFYIGGMHQDRKGRIWANTDSHGLVLFDEQRKCFVKAKMSEELEPSLFTAKIFEDDEGWFWFAYKLKPIRYNPETGEVWHQKNNPRRWPIFDLYSSVFFMDSRQTMWLSEFWFGYKYDMKTHTYEQFPEILGASDFVEDSLGRVWFGRYYNRILTCYDHKTKRFTQYGSNKGDPDGLYIGQWVAWVHLDKRGILWTLDVENINAFDPISTQPFQFFKEDLSKGKQSLPLGEVSDVFPASDGRYYVCYWMEKGGMVVLDSNFQVQEKWGWVDSRNDNLHLIYFWNSVEDNEGNIWMSQQNGSFLIYNIKTRQRRTFLCSEFKGSSAHMAMKDSHGNLWWGLWRGKGITQWDSRTRKFNNYPLAPYNVGIVTAIQEDGPHLLWLGTEAGLIKFDRSTGQCVKNFVPPVTDSIHRLKEVVHGLVKANDSTLIGGCVAGIFEFNLKTERFDLIQFKDVEKVPRSTSDMVMDDKGYVYYGYIGGAARFHPFKREMSLIPLTELVGFTFQPRFFPNPLPNGRLAFGANDRFVVLDVAALESEPPVPVPRVTLFTVDGDTTALGRDLERPVRLRHHENYFSLHFSSFAPPDVSVLYSYRLVGLRNEWSTPTPSPGARFTNVPPGSYTFEVRAQLANGKPTKASAFRFEVLPPYWQTWWFRLLAVAAVAILVRFVFRYRLRQQLEKEAIRQRIARDLHDEVGSTLTTISILSESVLRNVELDGEQARLSGIGEKARTAMSSMSDIVWSVNPQNDSMDKIVERMIRFATDTLEPQGISPVFDIEKAVYALHLPMEQRKDFYLFFKEATTNVAKHSRAGKAVFSMKKENGHLVFELRDDGNGLPETQGNSLGGNGLKNMAARAAALGAEFEIGNHSCSGASVLLKIPLR